MHHQVPTLKMKKWSKDQAHQRLQQMHWQPGMSKIGRNSAIYWFQCWMHTETL
jgi:hypothetical protein